MQFNGWFANRKPSEARATAQERVARLAERSAVPVTDDRIDAAASALHRAGELLQELEADMRLRTAALDEVREQEASYQRLAELHKEQAEAGAAIVRTAVAGKATRTAPASLRMNLLFFVLGAAASFGVNLLTGWLQK
jgi:hypothetical protein